MYNHFPSDGTQLILNSVVKVDTDVLLHDLKSISSVPLQSTQWITRYQWIPVTKFFCQDEVGCLHCLPAGFLIGSKCHKNASPSNGNASDVLIIRTCPWVSTNMGPILWYQRPCTTTCTEIPLTEKECSNISPLTQYSQCSVHLKSCNMSTSHSWHAHPFKTYGA